MIRPTPRCAVVIPTYNCVEYLPAALASIEAQKVEGLEVIVVDDGSTDGTAALLGGVQPNRFLGRLRLMRTNKVGPSLARNFAIEATEAPLIAFLDADDVWLPGKLADQLALHQARPEILFSFTDYRHRGPTGEDRGTCFEFWRHQAGPDYSILPNAHSFLLGCNLVGTSTVVADREALLAVGGFLGEMPSSEDWDLWLKLARCGAVARSGFVGCDYLMRANSLTASRANRIKSMEIILQRAEESSPAPFPRDVRLARARILTARAEHARELGEPFRAALAHARALTINPSVRALRAFLGDVGRSVLQPMMITPARPS